MDQDRFGILTRQMAVAPNRRAALRLMAAGVAAAVAPVLGARLAAADAVTPASAIVKGCKLPGQRCSGDKNCCGNHCAHQRCRCINKGGSCLVALGGGLPPLPVHALCCRNKCSKHDHKCR
ncbi:MAG TPA: hypothetical protein VFU81_01805 [Thermomicrobiales bacterium]|nr:hypothetical protein [Thermomicrobiales bacterium]